MSILRQVPSKAMMQRELKKVVFGDHLFCPRCGDRRIKKYENRYRCKTCRKPFSLTSVTWLRGMKISLDVFWTLLWCWTRKYSLDQATDLAQVSKPTARRWYEKFREHIPVQQLQEVRLSGIIQMDEAYRGGKKKGFAIVGAKEKRGKTSRRKRMAFEVVHRPSVTRGEAVDFLGEHVKPDSDLHTDGAAMYKTIEKWWRVNHRSEIHKQWEFELTSEIEGIWGTLTTFIRRMYHHVTREKIREVLYEFQARQMYPEWFGSPGAFLKISLQPLAQPMLKTSINFPQQQNIEIPIKINQNSLTSVPS